MMWHKEEDRREKRHEICTYHLTSRKKEEVGEDMTGDLFEKDFQAGSKIGS